jgi:cell division inhibitor SepF
MPFKKKNAMNRAQFIKVDPNTDVYELANTLLKGIPLVLNFEKQDVEAANPFIVFLSGVTYAIDGVVEMIQEKIYVFALKSDLKDKSLRSFIDDNKEKDV